MRSRLSSEFDPAAAADSLRPFLVSLIESIVKGIGTSGATVAPAVGVHDLDTSHSGTLPWARVNKVGSALSDIVSRAHAGLTGLGEDDHSQYVHISNARTINGGHTWAATQTYTGAPGISSPDGDQQFIFGRAVVGSVGHVDYAGFAHRDWATTNSYAVLQDGADGETFLNTSAGGAIYHRVGNADVMIMNSSRLNPSGSILKDLGDYNRKWRTLFAAELYVETLVAQSVLATIGGRIMVAPTVKLIADIDSSQTTIDTDYSSLLNGDYVYMATAPGGLAQIEVMKITSSATAITGGYRYNVIRALDGTPANSWLAGDAMVSLGNAVGKGYIELTSTSTIHNHLGPTVAIYTRTGTATWNQVAPTVAMGNLRSFVDYSSDEMGFAVGNDLTLAPASGFKGSTNDRTDGLRMFNVGIKEYQSGALFLALDTNGLEFTGVDQSYARVRWVTSGDTAEIGTHTHGDGYKRMDLRSWAATKSAVRLGAWNSGQTNSPVAYIEVRQDTYASEAYIIADEVGVGTTSPAYKLHVVGSTAALAVDGAGRFGQGGMWGAVDGPSSGWAGFGANFYYSSSTPKYRATNYASMMFCSADIGFNTASSGSADATITWSQKMIISNAGLVGINTGSPESRLDVATANTGEYIRLTGAAYGLRVGQQQAGQQWISMGVKKTGADNNYKAETADNAAVNHRVMEFHYNGDMNWLYAAHAADDSTLTMTTQMTLTSGGLLWVGNSSDIGFGSKIQTDGNVWAAGAITSAAYWQVAATTVPAAASGYCRVTLRSSDNALVAVMPSGNVRVLAVN